MSAADEIEAQANAASQVLVKARMLREEDPWWLEVRLSPHHRSWTAGPLGADGPRYAREAGHQPGRSAGDVLAHAAAALHDATLRPGTVEVGVTRGTATGTQLKDPAVEALCEAWGVPVPEATVLKADRKAFRAEKRAEKAARAAAKDAKKAKERRELIARQRASRPKEGVSDLATFLKAVQVRADSKKLKKAMKMLKADRFELFNDVADDHVIGVVKSQTDAKLRYACRLAADGSYACCTQNLNVCGGLRGSMCKHLLVLVVGLVQARELDPEQADQWIEKTIGVKPELDKDVMSEVFLKYQGAEAGEVDWRPTETMPEDFYAY